VTSFRQNTYEFWQKIVATLLLLRWMLGNILRPVKGKLSAVRLKSGNMVANSVPGLRGPTPLESGRNPEVCPSPQSKSWREREGRALALSGGEAASIQAHTSQPLLPEPLNPESLSRLIGFFRNLDQWDRKTNPQEVM
jgi:hypothetical protein